MNALVEENSLSSAVDPSPSEPPGRMVRAMITMVRRATSMG